MSTRRPLGTLESEILDVLWRSPGPTTPAEVLDELDAGLAYTTIMTVLSRLWKKGLVTRTKKGRAYAYVPVMGRAEFVAHRMSSTLASAPERKDVLTHFVGGLSKRDAAALRAVLQKLDNQ